jgi:hypothetical protein
MYNIAFRNCGLVSYGTVQSKWSAQTIWPGPTTSITMACVDRPKIPLQNIHNHVCTILTQTTLQILTTLSTSNPVPNIIKELKCWRKYHIGKNELWNSSVYFYTVFNITYFSHQLFTLFYVTSQNLNKQTICNTNIHFTISTTYVEFQTSTTIVYTRKLNFWWWNKTPYIAMER